MTSEVIERVPTDNGWRVRAVKPGRIRRFLIRMFGLKVEQPSGDTRLYQLGGGWGNRIEFYRWPTVVVGWLQQRPRPGDLLMGEMQSGRIGVWRFVDVDMKLDPPDMFFADVMPMGYAGEHVATDYLLRLVDPRKDPALRTRFLR